MLETAVVLTPIHYCYLIGVVILGVMIREKTRLLSALPFSSLGFVGLGTIRGRNIQTVFNAILYAGREFMEIIATIARATAPVQVFK